MTGYFVQEGPLERCSDGEICKNKFHHLEASGGRDDLA